ncbi:MAG: hypothetical protein ACM31D_03645 [Bacteroidota bacterium]
MLTAPLRVPTPHARRGARTDAATDPHLLCHRRHAVLVAGHAAPVPRHWLRWFEDRPQPGRKVY